MIESVLVGGVKCRAPFEAPHLLEAGGVDGRIEETHIDRSRAFVARNGIIRHVVRDALVARGGGAASRSPSVRCRRNRSQKKREEYVSGRRPRVCANRMCCNRQRPPKAAGLYIQPLMP